MDLLTEDDRAAQMVHAAFNRSRSKRPSPRDCCARPPIRGGCEIQQLMK